MSGLLTDPVEKWILSDSESDSLQSHFVRLLPEPLAAELRCGIGSLNNYTLVLSTILYHTHISLCLVSSQALCHVSAEET